MEIKNIVVTGDKNMIHRHKFLFQEMSPYFDKINYVHIDDLSNLKIIKNSFKSIYRNFPFIPIKRASEFLKKPQVFIKKSQRLEKKIRSLDYQPDFVFHIYGMFSPFWDKFDIPYGVYLDYTMALARKNWLPWTPFKTEADFQQWIKYEAQTYRNASLLFTKSNRVKHSLIADYGIEPSKITVLYSSGQFLETYQGEKNFGSKQILFNGSDFERKGGDLLLAGFQKVRQVISDAKLVIVGDILPINQDGVSSLGFVSSSVEMRNIFLATDLVVSPARCEPLGLFLIESMNHGIPCIVSNQDGMPEIIEHEVNGIVISNPTVDTLAEQIIYLLTNKDILEKMSMNARHKVATQLNWNVIAKKLTDTLLLS